MWSCNCNPNLYIHDPWVPKMKLLSLAQAVLNIVVFAWSMQWKLCACEHFCTNQALKGKKEKAVS